MKRQKFLSTTASSFEQMDTLPLSHQGSPNYCLLVGDLGLQLYMKSMRQPMRNPNTKMVNSLKCRKVDGKKKELHKTLSCVIF